jgi:hypothetical protein
MDSIKNIITALFVLGIFILHPSMNKGKSPISHLHYFIYGNTFNISLNEGIDKDKVQIKWSCENRDAECSELIIYSNGQKINDIPFEEGNQNLIVYYNNKVIGTLNQNKLNKNHSHQYNIKLEMNKDMITLYGDIMGPASSSIKNSISFKDFIIANN